MSTEQQRDTIDRLLNEAQSALTDRKWPHVRELMQRVLEMDSQSDRAKALLVAAHGGLGEEIAESADALARGAYSARASRALERKFGLEPDAPPTYLRPDRSDFTPNRQKTLSNDVIDVGWAEGALSDGRPFRVETWAQDQITSVTIFMPTLGIEDASNDQLRDLLVEEGLLVFLGDYRRVSGAKLLDASNSEMWSVNTVIGYEDNLLTECTVTLSPHPRGRADGEQDASSTP